MIENWTEKIIRNALYGNKHSDIFTPKKWSIYQMKKIVLYIITIKILINKLKNY